MAKVMLTLTDEPRGRVRLRVEFDPALIADGKEEGTVNLTGAQDAALKLISAWEKLRETEMTKITIIDA